MGVVLGRILASSGQQLGLHGGSVHESAWPMAAPLAVLAVPSVLIGLLGTPWNSRFAGLLNPEEALEMAEQFSWGEFLPLAGASVAISVSGITLAVLAYACLLYTSPSPRDLSTSRMPSSA